MFKKLLILFLVVVSPLAFANSNKVNINTASKTELMNDLTGISSQQADAIIKYRQNSGAFLDLQDLLFAKGVGRKFIMSNYDKMTVGKVNGSDRKNFSVS